MCQTQTQKHRRPSLLLLAALILPGSALARWELDNAGSELNFISVKAGDIGEVHRFDELSGTVEDDGSASVEVQLASVDTAIAVRDERMREMLFETGIFPVATITTQVDMAEITALPVGDSLVHTAEVLVELHGEGAPLLMDLRVTRLSASRVAVTTVKPVIVNASVFSLAEGVEKLREVAGLPSISKAVPVQFFLTFERGA